MLVMDKKEVIATLIQQSHQRFNSIQQSQWNNLNQMAKIQFLKNLKEKNQ
jgi:hypothetical protein